MLEQKKVAEQIKNNPNQFDFKFQYYLSRGFEICNKYAVGFILFFTLFMLISVGVGELGFVGEMVNRIVVTPIMLVGVSIVANKISKEVPYNFDEFWKGFHFLSQLVLVALIQYGIYFIFLAPILFSDNLQLYFEWFQEWQLNPSDIDSFPNFPLWYLLLLFPIVYFSVTWVYAPLFVVFYNLPAWEAMEASKAIVDRKWWIFALFYFSIAIIAMSGSLFFLIGVLYTAPISVCIFYASFEDLAGFYLEEREEDDLMKHLIERGF